MGLVLVVEDDPTNAVLVDTIFTRAGHKVLAAVDGTRAMECARHWQPDLVLLDVSLSGGMTGLDVCRALRADPVTAAIPVLMLSGWAFDSDVEAGRAAGADDYLGKPFTAADLLACASRLLTPAPAHPQPSGPDTPPAPTRTAGT